MRFECKVLIVSLQGREKALEETLKSLGKSTVPPSMTELVVVLNGKNPSQGPNLPCRLENGLPVRYEVYPGNSKSCALNHGISRMEGNPLIVFFDDDLEITPETLCAYDEAVRVLPHPSFYGGSLEAISAHPIPESWPKHIFPESIVGTRLSGHLGLTHAKILFLGANWACFREPLLEVGGFDARFGPGSRTKATGEESLIQTQLKHLGVQGRFVPGAHVRHFPQENFLDAKYRQSRAVKHGTESGLKQDPRALPRFFVSTTWLLACSFAGLLRNSLRSADTPSRVFRHWNFYLQVGRLRGLAFRFLVDRKGIEPSTSTMRTWRSPN